MNRLLLLAMFSSNVFASSALWVDDNIKIPMRSDASFAKNNIVIYVPINSEVNLLQNNSSGWSEVEFKGYQGWMVSRYLSDKPLKNTLADNLSNQLLVLKANLRDKTELAQRKDNLLRSKQNEIELLSIEVKQSKAQKSTVSTLQKELSNSVESNALLLKRWSLLKSKNDSLYGTDFLALIATIAFILGISIGFVFSRASARKVHSMYSI